jgi:hypothetical protein
MENALMTELLTIAIKNIACQPKEFLSKMPKISYLKEFKTIKLSFPRQSGHTNAILHHANNLNDSIIIVPLSNMASRLKSMTSCNVQTVAYLKANLIPQNTRYVFVDNYSFLKDSEEEMIYNTIISSIRDLENFGGLYFLQ